MEDRYNHTLDGQEVNEADINLIATEAALADDKVFSELFRLAPSADGVSPGGKGILAASTSEISGRGQSALFVPSGSADAKVYVAPFRAFVMLPAAQAIDAYKNLRSALCMSALGVTAGAPGGPFGQALQFPAATNNRWDLVYVRLDVDVDGALVNRFVKTSTTPAALDSIAVTKKTIATIVVLQGAEGTVPVRPSLPADSGSSYYIPIAYVLLPAGHTLTTAIAKANIAEIAPIVHMHRSTGAASLRVAKGAYDVNGYAEANEHWTVSNGRPKGYMSPTMGGKLEMPFALHLSGSRPTLPTNSTGNVIDDSLDWRNRLFKLFAHFSSDTLGILPWNNGTAPLAGTPMQATLLAQSFKATTSTKAVLATYTGDGTTGLATGAVITLYVDMTDGKLKCDVGSTAPTCVGIIWLEATGQFNNAF